MNLLSGAMGVIFTLEGRLDIAFPLMLAGAVFDFCDGLAARLLGAYSPMGKELDSLSDMVSFGLLPSLMLYETLRLSGCHCALAYVTLILAVLSGLRLAKFNIDERQTLSFIGLPTPANAIFWIGLTYLNEIPAVHTAFNGTIYFLLMLVCCFLLICELPMFSLKVKPGHNSFGENKARYILIASTVVILLVSALLGFQYFAASPALIILLYLLLSILF